MPAFAREIEECLKREMARIGTRDGFDKCIFDETTMVHINAITGLTDGQQVKWAKDMRERYADLEELQMALTLTVADEGSSHHICNCFITCCDASPELVRNGLVIPKSRSPTEVYQINGQASAWNEQTKQLEMLMEKKSTTIKQLHDALAAAGATHIQIHSFAFHDGGRGLSWGLGRIMRQAAKPGFQFVQVGIMKTKYVAPRPAPPPPRQQDDNSSAVIQQLMDKCNHLEHVNFQMRGSMGAAKRKANIPVHAENDILKEQMEQIKKIHKSELDAERDRRSHAEGLCTTQAVAMSTQANIIATLASKV